MDTGRWISEYRGKIARAEKRQEQVEYQRIIAKKILRACYSLVMYKDKQWLDSPEACGQQFLAYYPEKQTEIERLGILLSGRVIPKRS